MEWFRRYYGIILGGVVTQVKQARLNFTTMVGIPEGAAVMTGTFSIHGKPVKILFDSGATHSFINQSTQVNLGLNVLRVKNDFKTQPPEGKYPPTH
jgi:hypothetical protein